MSVTGDHPRSAPSSTWRGSVAVPRREEAARPRSGLTEAVLTQWHAAALDRELAVGVSPDSDPLLARRALRLTAGRSRRRLAAGLRRALRDSVSELSGLTAAVGVDRHEVNGARAVIGALERRLGDQQPIRARGAAMLQTLLTDGTGPLYAPVGPGSLGSHLRAAAAALEPEAR